MAGGAAAFVSGDVLDFDAVGCEVAVIFTDSAIGGCRWFSDLAAACAEPGRVASFGDESAEMAGEAGRGILAAAVEGVEAAAGVEGLEGEAGVGDTILGSSFFCSLEDAGTNSTCSLYSSTSLLRVLSTSCHWHTPSPLAPFRE